MLAAPAPLRAWVNPHLAPVGCIGAPAGPDPDADLAAAESWLRAQGCAAARGPLDGSTWYAYRANLGPSGSPPFLGEPSAPPDPWLARGYREVARYRSTLADNAAAVSAAAGRLDALTAAGWRILDLEAAGGFDALLPLFWRLSLACFAEAFSYSPLDYPDFAALYAPLRPALDPRLVLLGLDPAGEPAGLCLAYPDYAAPQLSRFILKTLAVLPEHRQAGLGTALVGRAHAIAADLGFTGGGIHALMWSGSLSRRITAHSGVTIREYALYEKDL